MKYRDGNTCYGEKNKVGSVSRECVYEGQGKGVVLEWSGERTLKSVMLNTVQSEEVSHWHTCSTQRGKGTANSQRQIIILDLILMKMGNLGDIGRIGCNLTCILTGSFLLCIESK